MSEVPHIEVDAACSEASETASTIEDWVARRKSLVRDKAARDAPAKLARGDSALQAKTTMLDDGVDDSIPAVTYLLMLSHCI